MVCYDCPICYDEVKKKHKNIVRLCTNNHFMHKHCFYSFSKSKATKLCPFCRSSLKIHTFIYHKYMKSTISSRNKRRI
jgi:hypothetical protein